MLFHMLQCRELRTQCPYWSQFGRTIHYSLLFFELSYILSLALLGFWFKESPSSCLEASWLPRLIILLCVPILFTSLHSIRLYWLNISADVDESAPGRSSAADTVEDIIVSVEDMPYARTRGSLLSIVTLRDPASKRIVGLVVQALRWAHSHLMLSKMLSCVLGTITSVVLLQV